MTKVLFIFFLFSFSFFISAQNENINLLPDNNYPLWLKTNLSRTDQTSGITFIKKECNVKYFLLADDIGAMHLLKITDDTLFAIIKISFSVSTNWV